MQESDLTANDELLFANGQTKCSVMQLLVNGLNLQKFDEYLQDENGFITASRLEQQQQQFLPKKETPTTR